MTKTVQCLLFLAFVSRVSAETVIVRSGNGPVGGTDAAVTLLRGPQAGNFGHKFSSTDFATARYGQPAFILPPNYFWTAGFIENPSAQLIGTNPNAAVGVGNTALYAVSFQITSPFVAATLNLSYAADNGIGEAGGGGPNSGVYLNGTPVCGSTFSTAYDQDSSVTCAGVGPMLVLGTNWLYIENWNAGGPAGLLFSATITTTDQPSTSTNSAAVTVRSGNGSIGETDDAVTFLLGPESGFFGHVFTAADFASVQVGPPAVILSPNPLWIPVLSDDPFAQWIATNPSAACCQGNTALYAIRFQIPNPFSAATLNFNYAVDNGIGEGAGAGPNGGLYLNGTPVCVGDSFSTDFAQHNFVECSGVSSALVLGTNWLYVEDGNSAGAAGLLFSATITTTDQPLVPSINAGGITTAANYASPVAPGSIAAAFGTFQINSPSAAQSIPLPTNLSGFSMAFSDGSSVPLFYASNGQVNFQIPWELTGLPQSTLAASIGGLTSAPQIVNLAAFSPGIFSTNGQGTGQGAILNSSYLLVDQSNPAIPGVTAIQIYCTGLGPVTNQPPSGSPAPSNPLAESLTPSITIGNMPAHVLFSGLAPGYVGLYQVNAEVPTGAPTGATVPVSISIGGATSNTVTIAIQGPVGTNPLPSISTLSPSSATAGSGSVTLTINGSGFISTSSVTFNGLAHTPSFISSSALMITLSTSDLSSAGSFPVVVSNPLPGGGNSNTVPFSITNPAPLNVTGNWAGAWGSLVFLDVYGGLAADIVQTGTTVTGTVTLTFSSCFTVGLVSGTLIGTTLTATGAFLYDGQVLFSGTVSSTPTQTQINGAYKVESGCTADLGVFTLTKQ